MSKPIKLRLKAKRGESSGTHVVIVTVHSQDAITEKKWAIASQKTTDWHVFEGDQFVFNGDGTVTVCVIDKSDSKASETITFRKKSKIFKYPVPAFAIALLSVFTVVAIGTAGYVIYQQLQHTPVPTGINQKQKRPDDNKSLDKSTGSGIDGAPASKNQNETLESLKKKEIYVDDWPVFSASFPNGSADSKGSVKLVNLSDNNVIMQANIYLDGKLIATTPALKPGQYSETAVLKANIPAGTYKAETHVCYYKTDGTDNFLGMSTSGTTLTIG